MARGWANGSLAASYYAGGGIAALIFAGIAYLPFGWRSLYVIGAIPIFIVGILRRSARNPALRGAEEGSQKTRLQHRRGVRHPAAAVQGTSQRLTTILIGAAAYGFAIWPATVLAQKYLQSTLHFTPPQVTMLVLPGGLVSLAFAILAGQLSDWIGRKYVVFAACLTAMVCFEVFYSGTSWRYVAYLWIPGYFGFFCAIRCSRVSPPRSCRRPIAPRWRDCAILSASWPVL